MHAERGLRPDAGSLFARLRGHLAGSWLHPLHLARRTLRRALAEVAPLARGRLLDVGCGGRRYADLFAHVDTYVGVDLPANSAGSSRLEAFADGLHLPFGAAAFDVMLCTEVLEHVAEPLALLCEGARVLKPGGLLLLTTPQTWGLHEAPHDYYRYTEYGLRYLASRAGLNARTVRPTCGFWATFGQRLSSLLFYAVGERWPLPLRALLLGVCAPLQLGAWVLDILFRHAGDPLDHLLVAESREDIIRH